MTRITDIGRKRTYLEAGFGKAEWGAAQRSEKNEPDAAVENVPPTKKPRKRRKKDLCDANGVMESDMSQVDQARLQLPKQRTNDMHKKAKGKTIEEKATASERRRRSRAAKRQAHTTCLACRKKGHAVKDCPTARTELREDDQGTGAPGRSVVGICYRCGSRRHNLSRCKKPVDPKDPLPFASCFLCSVQGHLVSSCPKNEGRGIFPKGGSCKLCGETSHLAKDCELRSQEQASKSAIILGGTHTDGGADEDDFHVYKRRLDAVQKAEKPLLKVQRNSNPMSVKPRAKVVVFK